MSVAVIISVNNLPDFGNFALNRKQALAQEMRGFRVPGAFGEHAPDRSGIWLRQEWGGGLPLSRPILNDSAGAAATLWLRHRRIADMSRP